MKFSPLSGREQCQTPGLKVAHPQPRVLGLTILWMWEAQGVKSRLQSIGGANPPVQGSSHTVQRGFVKPLASAR